MRFFAIAQNDIEESHNENNYGKNVSTIYTKKER